MSKTIGQLTEKGTPVSTDLIEIEDGATGVSYKAQMANIPGLASGLFRGCRLYRSTAQTFSTGVATTHTWDSESFDTNGFHDTISNTDRITIPSGVSKVILYAQLRRDLDASGNANFLYIEKYNSSNVLQGRVAASSMASASHDYINCSSGPISVTAGDYFIVKFLWEVAGAMVGGEYGNFFSIQVLE